QLLGEPESRPTLAFEHAETRVARRRGACGPWRDARAAPPARLAYRCGREIRGAACAASSMAGTFASSSPDPKKGGIRACGTRRCQIAFFRRRCCGWRRSERVKFHANRGAFYKHTT